MVSDKPLSPAKLAEVVGNEVTAKEVNQAAEQLNEIYEQSGRSFRAEQVANGWQFMTLPQYGEILSAVQRTRAATRLGPAAMETLAVVAYKQPVLRAEIEAIRGVACGEVLRTLMDRKVVKIVGRAEELGRPMLYGTTKRFLELFGLASLKDLPAVEQFQPGKTKTKTKAKDKIEVEVEVEATSPSQPDDQESVDETQRESEQAAT